MQDDAETKLAANEKELSDAKETHATQIQTMAGQLAKSNEDLTESRTNYADVQRRMNDAEANHIKALAAKDEEFRLRDEEHAVCSAALLLKETELTIIRDRIVGYEQTIVNCQRMTEAGKDARQRLEAQLVEKDNLKVWWFIFADIAGNSVTFY